MCGRFALRSSAPEVARILGLEEAVEIETRYNIAPSQSVPVCRADGDGHRSLARLRWGLIPHWAKDERIGYRMINARSETVAEKPAFRAAFKGRRCLVPADGYYEWRITNRRKQPYMLHLSEHRPFCFAGLWARWRRGDGETVESFTIMTTVPNRRCAEVHDRMPVILPSAAHEAWLDPDYQDLDALHQLLRPYPDAEMSYFAISTAVNNPRNDDPRCVTPLVDVAAAGEGAGADLATGDLFDATD